MLMISCKFYLLLYGVAFIVMTQPTYGQNTSGVSNDANTEDNNNQQPLLQRIEGVWISDLYSKESYSGLPFYILIVHNGKAKLDMIGYGYAEALASNSPSDIPKEERATAQKIEEKNSSLYIAWANEKMKVPNQTIVSGLSETGGDMAYELTKQGTSKLFGDSFFSDLGSDYLSNTVSDIFSSMISAAFTPSKRISILEMNIQQDNEYELTAHADIQEIKIKGEGKPIITKNAQVIHFTKYDPASGVFFDIPFKQKIYVPGDGFLNEIPLKYQEMGNSYLKYYDLRVPTHISQETLSTQQTAFSTSIPPANPFNIFQIKKLQYYNEQRVLSLGYDHSTSKAYLGVKLQIKEDKKGKKGCYVYDVHSLSPAYLFDIQEGDYLLSINGFEIDTPEQAEKYIDSLKPYEWITIRLKRGKKIKSVEIELSKY